MRTIVLALAVVSILYSGCHYRAGGAMSGVMTMSSTVETDNPILVDAFVRIDKAFIQVEASYGYRSYTYDYETVTTTEEADLEVFPLILTARVALGKPKASGIRKLWLAGVGAVFNTGTDTDIGALDEDDINAYRISLGHEWDAGKLLVLVEAVYQASSDIVADGVTFTEAVDVNLSGSVARVAVGYRF